MFIYIDGNKHTTATIQYVCTYFLHFTHFSNIQNKIERHRMNTCLWEVEMIVICTLI